MYLQFDGEELTVSPNTPKELQPKKFGKLAVGLALKFVVKWAKPLILDLVVLLIREAAKNDKIENVVEQIIEKLDPDHDGEIN